MAMAGVRRHLWVIFAKKVLDFCAKLIFSESVGYGVVKKQAFSIYRFTLKVFQERNRHLRCTEDWQLERDVLFLWIWMRMP